MICYVTLTLFIYLFIVDLVTHNKQTHGRRIEVES